MSTNDRQRTLYRSEYEHDACGVGMVANLSGEADHAIVAHGLTILKRLMHRGATGNDPETGDGAGLLLRIPRAFFRKTVPALRGAESFGVAMIFGGEGEEAAIEAAARGEGCEVLAWRDVPTDPSAIGTDARKVMPRIRQLFLAESAHEDTKTRSNSSDSDAQTPLRDFVASCDKGAFERKLLVVRRQIERAAPGTYVCSCSSRTVVYKGLLLATQIERFYPDLSDPDFVSPFAIVHQRYSTNTFPSWELAHPFRALAHNGEINALKGNLGALAAREPSLASPLFGADLRKLLPVVRPGQSDSASLDNLFELLVAAGRDAPHAMMMLLPQAWGAKYHVGHDVRAFFEYHSALMEPWDGPAAVAFTDGLSLGAALDRNGLRPARWTLTRDGLFFLASEAGVLDVPPADVARRGRLGPGTLLWLDLEGHRLVEDGELKAFYARRRPYRRWVRENRIPVTGLFTEIVPSAVPGGEDGRSALLREQARFGWTLEDVELILRPMAETGAEPVGAMGNDAALACLSKRPRSLFDHFHQLFAQVTNPPIDPIREELVMSIMTYIGNQANILDETPEHAHLVKMTRPVLTDDELRRMRNVPDFPARTLSLFYTQGNLRAALNRLARAALESVGEGAKIIVLSDREVVLSHAENAESAEFLSHAENAENAESSPPDPARAGRGPARRRIPSLLAVAAVNKALAEAGVRPSVGVVVESGEVREVHHFAVLLGFGATAVNPWLALATVSEVGRADAVKAAANYVGAVCKGLMKILSKMGISTLRSYRSARIFEAVGLGPKLVGEYFAGVASPVGGLELEDIERRLAEAGAADAAAVLPPGGQYRFRKDGEEHLWTPQRVADFRESVRAGDYARFHRYTDSIDNDSAVTLRSRFAFREGAAVPLDEVEPVEEIVRHFVGGAMSLGSLSPEAHETIALALNGLGTMSNCGEGGENPERFGTDRNSAIKQVASGRFGVTIGYLRSAKDLQIKVAQGAKPGEGGQLPARKVDAFVARLRHAKPGTTLISPPPHHDIYSIEDLAQLIHDLRCANPGARVSVKLVSEAGVGTVAAGVAKAHADVVVVSGFDGGTGAAPLTSVKHAGVPWEPGLAEAHQTLVKNDLRARVKLQVDGQLRTGRDIVVGALLGADEFAFGTSMLVSLGCVQCRNCNLDSCPVGIATQKPELRAKFAGRPEHLQTYFRFLAQEVREQLAALGYRSLAEARGHAEMLVAKEGGFDFGELFSHAESAALDSHAESAENAERNSHAESAENAERNSHAESAENAETTLVTRHSSLVTSPARWAPDDYDQRELVPAILPALEGKGRGGEPVRLARDIRNADRSVGAGLSGEIAARFGADGLPDGSVQVDFRGVAGQSFGAFLARGVTFALRGEANDYVGKGLSGGLIAILPPEAREGDVLAGNVIAYGATSGAIYVGGRAGERFGIRNSGATLVAEGIGDHGCEYMTGGVALILGPTGVNFAAGMTGGVAYVLDETGDLDLSCNLDSVDLFPVEAGSDDEAALRALLAEHAARTGSPKARRILDGWPSFRPRFVRVSPTGGVSP